MVDLHLQGRAFDPQVAVDANGNATAVWSQSGGANSNIWANSYIAGVGWQSARVIENLGGSALDPTVALNAAGNAVAVWRHGTTVYANRFVPGTGWETPTRLDPDPRVSEDPEVAMDPGGNATAVWRRQEGVGIFSIVASRYVPGSGWDSPARLTTTDFSARHPRIAMDLAGCATTVWQQHDGTDFSIYANRYTPGSGWGTATTIDAGPNDAEEPQVAMDISGHAMAVWSQRDGADVNAYANRYVPGSGWGTAALLEGDVGIVSDAQVALDDNANAIAVWRQFNGTEASILANRFAPGFGWGTSEIIEAGADSAVAPQVTMDPGGNGTAVWSQLDGTEFSVYTNRYDLGTGWGSAATIENLPESALAPQVAVGDTGDAVAVWLADDAAVQSVYANRQASGVWGSATLIEHDNWDDARLPQVALDPEGNAISVWTQFDGGSYKTLAGHFEPGRGWRIPESISSPAQFTFSPSIAVNGDGHGVAVWNQVDGGRFELYANDYTPGSRWGTAVLIDTGPNDAEVPQVAMDDSGRAIAVWSEFDGTANSIYASRFVPGTGWGAATLLETDPSDVFVALVAMDADGSAMAVWEQSDGAFVSVYANHYVPGAGWGGAVPIDAGTGHSRSPQVAMGAGNAVAVWQQSDGPSNSIYANRFIAGSGWEGAQPIDAGTREASLGHVAMDADGNAIAVWMQYDDLDRSIYANRYVPGTGWASATLVETNANDVFSPQLAMNPRGSAVTAWTQSDGTFKSVYANRYVPGIGWGSADLIETNVNDVFSPQVAMDGGGNALVVWSQLDGNRDRIYANRFVSGARVPLLDITSPTDSLTNSGEVTVAGTTDPGATVTIDGAPVPVDVVGIFTVTMSLSDGTHTFEVVASNSEGESNSALVTITVDTTPPSLVLNSPLDGATTKIPTVTVVGTTEIGARVAVNGVVVAVGSGGGFAVELALVEGDNVISATARDVAGNTFTESLTVTFLNPVPGLEQDLQDTQGELDTLGDTLGNTQNEVDAAQALLAAQGTQLLLSVVLLGIFATLTGFLIVVYLRGRIKPRG